MEALRVRQKRLQKTFYFLFSRGNSRWQKGGVNFFFYTVWEKKYNLQNPCRREQTVERQSDAGREPL